MRMLAISAQTNRLIRMTGPNSGAHLHALTAPRTVLTAAARPHVPLVLKLMFLILTAGSASLVISTLRLNVRTVGTAPAEDVGMTLPPHPQAATSVPASVPPVPLPPSALNASVLPSCQETLARPAQDSHHSQRKNVECVLVLPGQPQTQAPVAKNAAAIVLHV